MTPRGRLDEAYFRDLMRGCGWMMLFLVGTAMLVLLIVMLSTSGG